MSFIWAIIWMIVTGVIFSYLFKRVLSFFIGLVVGSKLYQVLCNLIPGNLISAKNSQSSPLLFLTITFEVLGHLSKAKGQVTQNDINLASQFIDQLQLDNEKRKLAQASFNLGKSENYPLQERLREFYDQYRFRKKVLMVFCELLIQAAISDGILHVKEERILYIVAQELHIPHSQMAIYIQMIMASYQFQRGQYYQSDKHHQHERYQQDHYQGSYQRYSSQADINKTYINRAYQVLGIDSFADITTIKRAYRKLMNEHHPDKLVSKGLPKEVLEVAKKRAQEIQTAYDLIKAKKGFK